MAEVKEKKRTESVAAVFPCVLDIIPAAIFNVKQPIVLGVRVVEGVARIGTPICIPSKEFIVIGRITGIQKNHVDQTEAKKGEEFASVGERRRTRRSDAIKMRMLTLCCVVCVLLVSVARSSRARATR